MTRILESLHYDTPRLDATLDALVQEVIDPFTVEKLVFMFASSATSTVYEVQLAKANRLYFIHSGGVGMATFLHCQAGPSAMATNVNRDAVHGTHTVTYSLGSQFYSRRSISSPGRNIFGDF